jgi:hypothetical protein
MEGQAARQSFYNEWQLIPTGKKLERSISMDQLEVHPDYPHHLDQFTDEYLNEIMLYLIREGAPPHRLYVMPNFEKPGHYLIIGWLKIFEAYKLLGISDLIPSLCYLEFDAYKKFWKNWQNCPNEIFDLK